MTAIIIVSILTSAAVLVWVGTLIANHRAKRITKAGPLADDAARILTDLYSKAHDLYGTEPTLINEDDRIRIADWLTKYRKAI